jgi:xanthine dehydrogenase YagS FAD-binding subunit
LRIEFPTTVGEAIGSDGTYRAGGIDIQDLAQIRPSPFLVTDLTRVDALRGVQSGSGETRIIGATTTIEEVIAALHDQYPALTAAAEEIATPQVRAVATVAGNLAQSTRCWYFRNPLSSCFKTGGDTCPAATGDNLFGVAINQGPCIFPHPSTFGMALLIYDAEIEIDGRRRIPAAALWGDGSDPGRDNVLNPGELITAVHVPAPWLGERGGYVRSISRFAAEWPLVESVCRIVIEHGTVSRAAVGLGGVANTPLRLNEVEAALLGRVPDADTARCAAQLVIERADPANATRYKVPLMVATITDALLKAFD